MEISRRRVLVINALRGNPNHGPDSQLYRALGYVPKSKRSSGLSRGTMPAQRDNIFDE